MCRGLSVHSSGASRRGRRRVLEQLVARALHELAEVGPGERLAVDRRRRARVVVAAGGHDRAERAVRGRAGGRPGCR